MCAQWDEVGAQEDWGALLVDARNAFNEVFRGPMLWHVRHAWPSGSRFAFNVYRHQRILVLRGWDQFIMSREGVTQGDPLAMILYAIALMPIIESLEEWLTEEKAHEEKISLELEHGVTPEWLEALCEEEDDASIGTFELSDDDEEIVIPAGNTVCHSLMSNDEHAETLPPPNTPPPPYPLNGHTNNSGMPMIRHWWPAGM